MITHKNSMTPLAKRRKAVAEAVRQATAVSCNSHMWHEQFEKALTRAGYKIAKFSRFELRQRGQPEGVRSVEGPDAGAVDLR